jgi:hypothetical protein
MTVQHFLHSLAHNIFLCLCCSGLRRDRWSCHVGLHLAMEVNRLCAWRSGHAGDNRRDKFAVLKKNWQEYEVRPRSVLSDDWGKHR